MSKYHQPLKDWIDKHPQNVSYLSHVSQNEMLAICSSLTANAICDEVHTAKYFSIECDEVTSHKKAFMSIILRYVSNFQIHERCFKLVPVTSLTGRSLADVILSVLSDNQLSLMALVDKGFDGAANMSGKDEGVQPFNSICLTLGQSYRYTFIASHTDLIWCLSTVLKTYPQ